MRTTLTPEQINAYRGNGFLFFPDLLTADEVGELETAVLEAISTMGKNKIADGLEWIEGDGFYDKVFTQRMNLWRINDTVKRYTRATELGQMAARLAGVDAMRIWCDQALIKEPFANPTAYHLDNPFWSFHSHDSISIWIALDDATLENGCMWFLPGSHKMAGFEITPIGMDMNGIFETYPQMAGIDPVPVPMKAGDCSFHNGLVAHGAGPNMTRGRRMAMTAAFMPDGSTFNGEQNILTDDYFNSLAPGDPLNNDNQNPLV